MCIQELEAGKTYTNQAQSYAAQAEQYINTGRLIDAYRVWADKKWNEYQTMLKRIGKIKVSEWNARS
jgi:uncharacterized membrane protein (DUF2068 family)